RHVDVVRPGQVVVVGGAQEPEPVGQHLEDALREDVARLGGPRAKDLEDELLLAQARRVRDVEVARDLREIRDAQLFEGGEIERDRLGGGGGAVGGGCSSSLAICVHSASSPSPVWADTADTGPEYRRSISPR